MNNMEISQESYNNIYNVDKIFKQAIIERYFTVKSSSTNKYVCAYKNGKFGSVKDFHSNCKLKFYTETKPKHFNNNNNSNNDSNNNNNMINAKNMVDLDALEYNSV